jgi:hypothetical protein
VGGWVGKQLVEGDEAADSTSNLGLGSKGAQQSQPRLAAPLPDAIKITDRPGER